MSTIKELTIGEFQAVHQIEESEIPWIDKRIQIVAILFRITIEEVEALPVEKFNELNNQVKPILENIATDLPIKQLIEVGDQTYKTNINLKDFKAGPVLRIHSFYRAGPIENLHKLFAELLEPIDITTNNIRNKTDQERESLPELVKQLPFAYVVSVGQYFKDLWNLTILDLKPTVAKELAEDASLNMDVNAANDAADKLTRSIILE